MEASLFHNGWFLYIFKIHYMSLDDFPKDPLLNELRLLET